MGVLGQTLGSSAGHMLGTYVGKRLRDDYKNSAASIGSAIGGALGSLTPYETGGRVKGGRKGEPKIILAHTGEWVLPIGIRPTKSQQSAIEKRKKVKKEKIGQYFV
jgi:hypothetical protein